MKSLNLTKFKIDGATYLADAILSNERAMDRAMKVAGGHDFKTAVGRYLIANEEGGLTSFKVAADSVVVPVPLTPVEKATVALAIEVYKQAEADAVQELVHKKFVDLLGKV